VALKQQSIWQAAEDKRWKTEERESEQRNEIHATSAEKYQKEKPFRIMLIVYLTTKTLRVQ